MVNQSPGQPQYEYEWQNPNSKSFDFGRTFTRTFDALKRDGIKMMIMAMMLIGLPMAIFSVWPMFIDMDALASGGGQSDIFDASNVTVFTVITLGGLLFIIAALWLQPALIQMAYGAMKQESIDIGPALKGSARYILPYFGLSILYFLGVFVGFIFLIIPAVFIAFGWMLSYQIMIIERVGVIASIGRAWNLSKGNKRWLLLLAIVFGVIGAIIGVLISIPLYFIQNPTLAMLEGASTGYWILNAVLTAAGQVVGTVLGAAWTTSAYVEIRQIREGLDLKNQADVFA